MKVLAVIPARYESTRFPGKPLADINGRPMIQVVYENVSRCSAIDDVLVATDDKRISDCVLAFGGKVCMTSPDHRSGTDRVAEAVQKTGSDHDIVVNVQGDEPGIKAEDLQALIALFGDAKVDIATLVTPFKNIKSFQNPNRVKAVLSENGKALYFSRSAVPFDRNDSENLDSRYQHVGIYAFRCEALSKVTCLSPSPIEKKESLEQLRWLENGYSISAAIISNAPFGIDTPEDLVYFTGS